MPSSSPSIFCAQAAGICPDGAGLAATRGLSRADPDLQGKDLGVRPGAGGAGPTALQRAPALPQGRQSPSLVNPGRAESCLALSAGRSHFHSQCAGTSALRRSTSASHRERKQSRKNASPFRSDLDAQLPSRPAELCFLYPASVPSRAAAKPPQQFRVSSHAALCPLLSLSSPSLYLMFPLLLGTRTQKGQILREMGPGFPGSLCGPRLEL